MTGQEFLLAGRIKFKWKILSCLALVVLFDWLFFGQYRSGWIYGIFMAALLFAVLFHNNMVIFSVKGQILAILSIILLFALIETPSALAIIISFLSIASLALMRNGEIFDDARKWLSGICRYLSLSWLAPIKDFILWNKIQCYKGMKNTNKITINIFIPAILTIVFIVLFAFANPIIGNFFVKLDILEILAKLFRLDRIIQWLFIIAISWPLIRPKFRNVRQKKGKSKRPSVFFTKEAIIYSLWIFNLLFLIQNIMDIRFLWGDAELPAGMSHAEYAHKGAYPLIFTALLAGWFVLISLKPGEENENNDLIKKLVYFWVVQNIFLVISSIVRLLNYIEEYSLTYWRVAAFIWMGLVVAGLAYIIARIMWQKSGRWLVNSNAVTLIVVFVVCCFVNFSRIIADYNVQHCKEVTGTGQPLDLYYLENIGPDALPALYWYQANFQNNSMKDAMIISEYLENRLSESMNNWREWTFRNYRLSKYLSKNIEKSYVPVDDTGWQTLQIR